MEEGPIKKLNFFELVDEQRWSINTNRVSAFVSTTFIIVYAVAYGIWFKVQDIPTQLQQIVKISLLLVLGTLGFGLAFLKSKKLILSSLYFNLLIISFSVLTYFLVHKMVSQLRQKTQNRGITIIPALSKIKLVPINKYNYEATFNQAIKCALSCVVSFSCFVGNGGIFQVYLFSLFTPIGYQLTRQVSIKYYPSDLGTIKIFVYGSVQGLICLVAISYYKKNNMGINSYNLTIKHPNLKHSQESLILSMIGGIIILLFFPLLAHESSIFYTNKQQDNFNCIFSIFLTMITSVLLSILYSVMFKQNFESIAQYKDIFIDNLLCSGVLTLNSSLYFSRPWYSPLMGLTSILIVNFIHYLRKNVSGSFKKVLLHEKCTILLIASIIGICIEQILKIIMKRNIEAKFFSLLMSQSQAFYSLSMFLVASIVFGLFLFSVINWCLYRFQDDLYSDSFSWHKEKERKITDIKEERSEKVQKQNEGEQENKSNSTFPPQKEQIKVTPKKKKKEEQKSSKDRKKSKSKSSKHKNHPLDSENQGFANQTKNNLARDFNQYQDI